MPQLIQISLVFPSCPFSVSLGIEHYLVVPSPSPAWDSFSHFPCFWWPWSFWVQFWYCADCLFIWIFLVFFSQLDWDGFSWERPQRWRYVRAMCCHLADVVFARFFHWKVTFSLLSILYFLEATHSRDKELSSLTLRREYPHQLFGVVSDI